MRAKTFLAIGFTGLIAVAASAACTVTFSLPTTAIAVADFGSCDASDTYILLDASQVSLYCATAGCGSDTYLLCDGTAWSGCDCQIPPGWGEYTGALDFGAGGGDGGGPGGEGGPGSGDTGPGSGDSGTGSGGDTGSGSGGDSGSGSGGDSGGGSSGSGGG